MTRARVAAPLTRDVVATLGPSHEAIVTVAAMHIRQCYDDEDDDLQRVVDEVQQDRHDCFIDTTWPACPRHPNHPLWLRDGSWCCEKDGAVNAKLGELR